jgi:hypothetical protein
MALRFLHAYGRLEAFLRSRGNENPMSRLRASSFVSWWTGLIDGSRDGRRIEMGKLIATTRPPSTAS